jgi:hypothetical protein
MQESDQQVKNVSKQAATGGLRAFPRGLRVPKNAISL